MSWPASIVRINPDREIAKGEWIEFARSHPDLFLESTDFSATTLYITGPRNLRIFWDKGGIHCGAPTPEIIQIMFQCAGKLDAVILGPKDHQYTSFEDWDRRTRDARARSVEIAKKSKQLRQKERLLLAAKIGGGLLLGSILYWLSR